MSSSAAGNDIERLLQRLGGGGAASSSFPPEVARQANQLLRKFAIKCKPGTLGKNEVCRPAVCVELACRQCGHLGYSREALVQQSMVKEAQYRDVFRRAEHALELTSAWSAPQLAMVLGGEQAVALAQRLLGEYEARYARSLPEDRRGGPARPFAQQSLYVAAAFFLATKNLKVRARTSNWFWCLCVAWVLILHPHPPSPLPLRSKSTGSGSWSWAVLRAPSSTRCVAPCKSFAQTWWGPTLEAGVGGGGLLPPATRRAQQEAAEVAGMPRTETFSCPAKTRQSPTCCAPL